MIETKESLTGIAENLDCVEASGLTDADALFRAADVVRSVASQSGHKPPEQIKRLIQWLRNASVTQFDFTIEGRQEVCKPKYLLTRDRDYIIGLLDRELAAELTETDNG